MLEISPDRICPESRWAVCFLCSLNAANEFGLHTSQEIKGCFWDLISIHSPALEMGTVETNAGPWQIPWTAGNGGEAGGGGEDGFYPTCGPLRGQWVTLSHGCLLMLSLIRPH